MISWNTAAFVKHEIPQNAGKWGINGILHLLAIDLFDKETVYQEKYQKKIGWSTKKSSRGNNTALAERTRWSAQ